MEVEVLEQQVVTIRLLPARTAEEREQNIVANIVVEEGPHSGGVPYIDEVLTVKAVKKLEAPTSGDAGASSGKPRLRYYAVGPSSYSIKCPLCRQRGDAAVMRAAGCKDVSFCLSLLSCVFPIFWLCCICTWCGYNRECTTKGVYCSYCGGKLGIQHTA